MGWILKELLNTDSSLNTEEIAAAEYNLNINTNSSHSKKFLKLLKALKQANHPEMVIM